MPPPGVPIASGASVPGPYRVTPSLDPANIAAMEHYDEVKAYLAPAESAFSTATIGLEAIAEARDKAAKNQAWNEYQQLLNVANLAEKQQDKICRAFDSARNNLLSAADALDKSLSVPLEAKAMGVIAGEIRAMVRGMKHEDRRKFIVEALQEGDMDVLTAVLGCNPKLSGMSKEEHAHFIRTYREAADPAAARRLSATLKAIDLLESRGPLVLTQVQMAMRGKWETVQKLRTSNSEAEKALLMRQA